MNDEGLGNLVRSRRVNAALAWVLVGAVVLTGVGSLLAGDLLWTGFVLAVVVVAVLPPLQLRTPWAMLPWEVLLVATLPVLGRVLSTTVVTGQLATYLSVAALALVVAVELHAFTPVRMNDAFALLFVVVATMATAGVWAVVRWLADGLLGTGFIASERALMWEFVASTVAGVLAGVLFVYYVRRRTAPAERLPEGVDPG